MRERWWSDKMKPSPIIEANGSIQDEDGGGPRRIHRPVAVAEPARGRARPQDWHVLPVHQGRRTGHPVQHRQDQGRQQDGYGRRRRRDRYRSSSS